MKTGYDIFTKDEKIVSYIDFVDTILDKLGFRKNMKGTRLLREFTIYIYLKNSLEIDIKEKIYCFINEREINIKYYNFYKILENSIRYADSTKIQNNFYAVFHTEYDYYYLSVKSMVIFIVNTLERNRF